jgi:hypothetical protein
VFVYFIYLTALKIIEIYKTRSFFINQKDEFFAGKFIIFMYLVALLFVSSITGTGLGEFNRYFVFVYALALILILDLLRLKKCG